MSASHPFSRESAPAESHRSRSTGLRMLCPLSGSRLRYAGDRHGRKAGLLASASIRQLRAQDRISGHRNFGSSSSTALDSSPNVLHFLFGWLWPIRAGASMQFAVSRNRTGNWLSIAAAAQPNPRWDICRPSRCLQDLVGVAKMHLHCASILLVRTPHVALAVMPRRADLRPAPVASVAALG